MKVTIGGSMSLNIMNNPYEPVKVESVFTIEKDVDDTVDIEDLFDSYQAKINNLLKKDLNEKSLTAGKEHNKLVKKLKQMKRED